MKKGFSAILVVVAIGILALIGGVAFISLSKKGASNTPERKFVALGDSITRANNLSSQLTGDNPEYSFSTGTKIKSVFGYLRDKGENLTSVNLAASGATSAEILARQVPNVSGYHPKYITLLTGGPDIGTGVSVGAFADNLTKIIAKLKQEDATILIGTIPDIAKIRMGSSPSCKENKIGLKMENFTEEKIKEFNRTITEAARQGNLILVDLYGTLDSTDASDYDCLHPNIEGQKKLAQEWIKALK